MTSSPMSLPPRAASSLGHASSASISSFQTANTHIYTPTPGSHHVHSQSISHTPSPSFGGSAFPFPNSSHLPSPAGVVAHVPSHTRGNSLHLGTITEVSGIQHIEPEIEQQATEELGAPTSGVYAQEGLWDDDSDDNDNDKSSSNNNNMSSWRARLSASTTTIPQVLGSSSDGKSVRSTKSAKSNAGSSNRSRSNTLTAQSVHTNPSPTTETTPWPWGRKASMSGAAVPPAPVVPQTTTVPTPAPVPVPVASASASGPSTSAPRRPSVSAAAADVPSRSSSYFPSPAFSPPTAQSSAFSSHVALPSPAAAAAAAVPVKVPKLRQSKSRMRLLSKARAEEDRPPVPTRPALGQLNVNNLNSVPVTQASLGKGHPSGNAGVDDKPKSAWKRGMDRLWRSKSAGGLRDAFHAHRMGAENAPPMPALPRQHSNKQPQMAPSAASPMTSPISPISPDMSRPISPGFARSQTPQHNGILAQLDQRYPSYRAATPLPGSPDESELDADPFAAYGAVPVTRSRRTSRSPLPADFMALPPVDAEPTRPHILRNTPSLLSLKSSLVPRLRKSKSMGITKRPASFFSVNRNNAASPLPSSPLSGPSSPPLLLARALSPEPAPGIDQLTAEAMGVSPLAPPRPLFYDSFDLGDTKEEENEEDTRPPSRAASRQRSGSVASKHVEETNALERVTTRSTTASHPGRPSTSQSNSRAPDLSIETDIRAQSISGSSAEALVTPSGTIASSNLVREPSSHKDSSECLDDERSQDGPADSPSFQDLYEQLGIWPNNEQKPSANVTPRAHTPAAVRSDRSECINTPSLYDSPSWQATISAFPTFDDPVAVTTSLDYDAMTVGAGDQRASMASSNFAVVPTDSCSHSAAHDISPTKPQWNRTHANAAGNEDRAQLTASGLWTSWRDVPRKSGGGSRGSSRDSSRERRPRVEEQEDMESESESEDDNVPLGMTHPEAAAAQQQKLVERTRRREARRAARTEQLRRAQTKSAKGLPSRSAGVPADALAGRLERVAVGPPTTAPPSRELPRPPRPDRSLRDAAEGASLSRATTAGRSSTSGHSIRSQTSGRLPSDGEARSRVPSDASRHVSQRAVSDDARRQHTPSEAASAQHSSHTSPAGSISHRRPRSHSNASRAMHTPTPEPTPSRRSTPVRCVIMSHNEPKAVSVDAYTETTARDVLASLRSRGDLKDGNWVVYESFAELSLERQVREFEAILSGVTRGWDATAPNCLVIRDTPPHTTFTRNIPDNAPFVGGWVHVESKPGKWNKRWLEVRGGQVFLSKNEKGKDEEHVSTLFSDAYTVRKQHAAPQPFVFALKRLEPAASFEDKSEHVHYIASDDSTGYKLQSAVFVSRSFALAQANPSIKARLAPIPHTAPLQVRRPSPTHSHPHPQSHPHPHSHSQSSGQPLVDLAAEPSAFTGRGLLNRI